jgi:hypothetical protein
LLTKIFHGPVGTRALVLVFIVCLIPAGAAFAQLSEGGIPPTEIWSLRNNDVPVITVTPPDMAAIRAEDRTSTPDYRFAVNLPVNAGIANTGAWTSLPDGSDVWRVALKAKGALAITLYFDQFSIPAGGELFLYNADRSEIIGAFTERNNRVSGLFATQLLSGDMIYLEYHRPLGVSGTSRLNISELAYAYRDAAPGDALGFGQSGPCEVNVACSEGDNWQEQQRGVMRIQTRKLGGSYWCSGSLVNNTRLDNMPYVLSADHCGRGATIFEYDQWIFYMDYNSTTCEDPLKPPVLKSLTGAVKKASGGDVSVAGSDFLLVLLKDEIPSEYNAYLNGWSRANLQSPNGVAIHHPMGDIKKISTYTQKITSASWTGGTAITHWRVIWAQTANGHGVTEGGSSGSPLFDNAGHIIGNLTGGDSSCDTANLGQPDYFGKFSYSWASCGADSTLQLRPWLDPDSTGVLVLEGHAVGVDDTKSENLRTSVYPNPSAGIINVSISSAQLFRQASVELIDIRGSVLMKATRNFTGPEQIDISALIPGIYILRITIGTSVSHTKIIKI